MFPVRPPRPPPRVRPSQPPTLVGPSHAVASHQQPKKIKFLSLLFPLVLLCPQFRWRSPHAMTLQRESLRSPHAMTLQCEHAIIQRHGVLLKLLHIRVMTCATGCIIPVPIPSSADADAPCGATSAIHENQIDCQDQQAESKEMVPVQRLPFEKYDGEHREYHQRDNLLHHLKLKQR